MESDVRYIRAGCTAADVHLTCSYPTCKCTAIPQAIKAALLSSRAAGGGEADAMTAALTRLSSNFDHSWARGTRHDTIKSVEGIAKAALKASASPAPPTAQAQRVTAALTDIAAERKRQVEQEGWTVEHDDEHVNAEMARAAVCYIMGRIRFGDAYGPETLWPAEWDEAWWKPGPYRRNLVKAGALIVAEIERLDRLSARREG